ncbi:MAG TPA: penicillin acylase family protein [Nitriliruptorales bacterium]
MAGGIRRLVRVWVVLAVLGTALAATTPAAATTQGVTLTYTPTGETVTIERSPFGVPHVYAGSTEAASYGLGYAGAQDRLWIIELLVKLIEGDSPGVLGPAVNAEQRPFVRDGYTLEERRLIFERLPEKIQGEMSAYVAGVNRYIDEANTDPSKLPHEFVTFGAYPVDHLRVESVISLYQIINSSAPGGVPIMGNLNLLRRLIDRDGVEQGTAKFEDLVRRTDPDAPTTLPRDEHYLGKPTLAPRETTQLRAHVSDARLTREGALEPAVEAPTSSQPASDPLALIAQNAAAASAIETAARATDLGFDRFRNLWGSNMQIVSAELSASGNALMTGGPQTDYSAPGTYWEAAVHVPGQWEARGMTIPPLNYLAVGRAPGHAWTFTNGAQGDMADVFVVRLDPANSRAYEVDGTYEPMECRTHSYTVQGSSSSAAGELAQVEYDTQEVCRTHHGPVISFDPANGIAYALRYAWWGREDLTVRAFRAFNTATSLEQFAGGAAIMPTSYNVTYADDQGNIAWWLTGLYPQRARDADVRLPVESGKDEWRGVRQFRFQPHAINPDRGWIANWNNYPAAGWESGRLPHFASRVEKLFRGFADGGYEDPLTGEAVNPDGRWDADDLTANMRIASYADDAWTLVPALPSEHELTSQVAKDALAVARDWDGIGYDADGDGTIEQPGKAIMSRWQSVARNQIFRDDLGDDAGWAHDYGELLRILHPDSNGTFAFDWLNGESRAAVAARTFETAVQALAEEFGNEDPHTWVDAAGLTRYGHLNYNLGIDAVDTELGYPSCGTFGPCLTFARQPTEDAGAPGYVPPHQRMNRGVYNQIVQYLDPPGERGTSAVSACSVVTPGNGGMVNALGQEDPNFSDGRDQYASWTFHDMGLTDQEVAAEHGGELAGDLCEPVDLGPGPGSNAAGQVTAAGADATLPATGGGGLLPAATMLLVGVGLRRIRRRLWLVR